MSAPRFAHKPSRTSQVAPKIPIVADDISNRGRRIERAIDRAAISTSVSKKSEELLAQYALDLENHMRVQECLADLSFHALRGMATDELYDKAVTLIGQAVRADYCRVLEVRKEKKLTEVAAYGSTPKCGLELLTLSLAEYSMSAVEPVMVSHLSSEARFEGKPMFDQFGLASAIAVKIGSPLNTVAILELFSGEVDAFTFEHADFAGTATNIIAAGIERCSAVEALRSAQSRLNDLISAGPCVIYALHVKGDALEPAIVGENILRVTGYSAREALRAEWWQEHAYPAEMLLAIADGSMARTGGQLIREYHLTRADGTTIWVRDEARLVAGSSDAPLEVVGTLSDFTEQKALEEQLRSAPRMENSGELASGFTHDLNNLLTVISGFTDLELYKENLEPRTREALEKISGAATGAIRLTDRFRAFWRSSGA